MDFPWVYLLGLPDFGLPDFGETIGRFEGKTKESKKENQRRDENRGRPDSQNGQQ